VIIITDGYIEAENRHPDTKITGYEQALHKAVLNGKVKEKIRELRLNIPKEDVDLKDVDFLICEINERRSGSGYDFEILKAYWEDWIKNMDANKVNVIGRSQAISLTIRHIREFIN
jgi:Na+-transporting NADH:ubiquinone oxidoreductase subunit NqrF